ncbi:unknown [Brachyspira sp. CAG:700]|nr:unknown [Brachyspira sp. CAG:700]
MKKIIFIFILFNIISLNLFGKYKYEDFYKTVDLSKCKDAKEMLYTLKICHSVGEAMNNGTYLWRLAVEISHFVDYYYYMIGAYKYLINYYNMGDEYTKELMKDIYDVCSNFKLYDVTSFKENKEYKSYQFAALLFNNSKEYTIDDYMSIINFGYRTNVLSREYLLNYLRDEDNFFLEGTHYYLRIFPITIEYKGKTIPKVTDSLTEFYYNFYGTKFKVEKIIIKENDTWTDIYNKYGDTRITRGSDYRLVSEIENYKSKTSNYYERLNDITNTFNDENNTIFTNFYVYYSNSINYIMENRYYTEIYNINDYYRDYYTQIGFGYRISTEEDENYSYKFSNLESEIKENVNSINDLEINISRLRGEISGIKYNLEETENELKKINKNSAFASSLASSISAYKSAIKNYEERIKEYKKEIETILKDIEKLEAEFEKAKKEALKKWLEYKLQNERTEYLTIPKEFIGKYFYKVS